MDEAWLSTRWLSCTIFTLLWYSNIIALKGTIERIRWPGGVQPANFLDVRNPTEKLKSSKVAQ